MMKRLELVPLSYFADVNPSTDTSGIKPWDSVSFIPMADVSNSGFWVTRQNRKLSDVSTGYTSFQEDDVLFAKITPSMENGKGAHVTGLTNKIGFGSTEFHVLRAINGNSARFVYHWTRTKLLRLKAEGEMVGTAGQQRVQKSFFDRFLVPYIPPAEQRVIARILDKADEAIQKAERVIAKQERERIGLLSDLLTYGLDEDGILRDPIAHPEQFQEIDSLGFIPIDWSIETVDSLSVHVGSGATPRGGSQVYQEEGIPFIRSQNVIFEELLLDDVAYINEKIHRNMRRSALEAHDVLINITGASIGRCCVVPEWLPPANVNQHVCAIRLSEANVVNSYYLWMVLASEIGQKQVDILNAGGNREGLNYSQLRSFLIPYPSESERNRIVNAMQLESKNLNKSIVFRDKLIAKKQGLMDDLLTGRVRVAQLNDEELENAS